MAHGLIAGKETLDAISKIKELTDTDTTKRMSKIIGAVAPFLGAFSAVAEIAGLFGDSELQKLDTVIDLINDGFSRMETRFDQLGGQIEDLKKAMKEQHFKTQVKPHLENLESVKQLVKEYFSANKNNRETRAGRLDLSQWHKQNHALNALRAGFDGVHDDSFCKRVTDFANADRRKVVNILVNLYSWMVKGTTDLILISSLLKDTDIPELEKNTQQFWYESQIS